MRLPLVQLVLKGAQILTRYKLELYRNHLFLPFVLVQDQVSSRP